jgi:hypothetical protein
MEKTKRKGLWFTDAASLESWLHGTMEGERIIRSEVNRRLDGKDSVLLVLYSDGWVEAYSERTVAVHVANKIHATTSATAQLAEHYLDLTLPKRFRRLYIPRNLRAMGRCEKITAEREQWRRIELELLAEIQGRNKK